MISLILIPLIFIIILTGLVFLFIGLFINRKGLKKTLLWTGGIITGTPLILISLGFLLTSQNHKIYAGKYKGTTDNEHVVTLELNEDKNFRMTINDCESIITGTWDNVLHDDYILELYLPEKEYGIQATLTESEISFYNTCSLGCLNNEEVELKKPLTLTKKNVFSLNTCILANV